MTNDEKTEAMDASEVRFERAKHTRFCLREVRSHLMGALNSGTARVQQMLRGPYYHSGDPPADAIGLLEWLIAIEAVAETDASEAYEQTKDAEDRGADILAAAAAMEAQDKAMKERTK